MRIIDRLDEMMETARGWLAGGSVGFIPIMSTLHEGHRALLQAAREACEITIVGIPLMPLQMNTGSSGTVSSVTAYSHDPTRELQFLSNLGVDVVFIPQPEALYPADLATSLVLSGSLQERMEQFYSPQAIREFATLMTKLLLLVRADRAYLGQKDFMQAALIRKIVRDLNIDVSIEVLPTVRESNGLALSSRNLRLSWTERQAAATIYQALLKAKDLVEKGERRAMVLRQAIEQHLATESLVLLRYTLIVQPDTLEEYTEIVPGTLFAIKAQMNDVLLVDNVVWKADGQWIL